MEQVTGIMMRLLGSEVCGTALPDNTVISEELLKKLYTISKSHDLAHIVGAALDKNKLLPGGEFTDKFAKQVFLSFYRYESLNYEYGNVCEALEKAGIKFIPLKGAVIRQYYPEPWMRTSCDIDILVHTDELKKAETVLTEKLDFKGGEPGPHDISLVSPGNIHVELHYDLIENDRIGTAEKLLSDIWSHASPENGGCLYRLSDEMFYYYHIAHMAKHFTSGGCGVRPFLDVWILNHRVAFDREKRTELLKKGNLGKFAETAERLSEVWFGNETHNEMTLLTEKYIMGSGVYGNMENMVAVNQSRRGGRLRSVTHRLFLPYESLKNYYPVLKKHRWLTPVCEVRRWFRVIRGGRVKRSIHELQTNKTVSQDKVREVDLLLNRLKLEK